MMTRKADGYYAIIPEWVLYHRNLSDGAVRLYGVLRRYADDETAKAWPSVATLGKRLGKSPRSIQRLLSELRAAKAVSIAAYPNEDRKTNTYLVHMNPPDFTPPDLSPTPARNGVGPPDKSVTQTTARGTTANNSARTHLRARVFEAVIEAWMGKPYDEVAGELGSTQRGIANTAARELTDEMGVTDPAEVAARAKRYKATWPSITLTPMALVKHWHMFGADGTKGCEHQWEMDEAASSDDAYQYRCTKCGTPHTVQL